MGKFISSDSEAGRRLTGAKGSRVVTGAQCRECGYRTRHHADCSVGQIEAHNKALDLKRQEKLALRNNRK